MPDSFGHPLQLPQILAGFGIDSFIFSRGLGDEIDDVGVVFRWRSPDGSEVRAFQQLPSYSNFNVSGDDAQARLEYIAERFGQALQRVRVDEVLLCDGEDHRRIRRDLPALCSELERRLPGTSFTIARYSDYVAAVDSDNLPAHTGELLGSRLQNVLRGVNSARLYIKRANERAERRLLEVETLGALRTLHTGERFPVLDFRLAWRRLLENHPHDSICGCSCDEVHRDMLVRYERLERTILQLQRRALGAFAVNADDDGATAGAVNLLPYRRRGVVERPGMEPAVIELDGFSARPVAPTPKAADADQHPHHGTAIESDRLRVEAAPDGSCLTLLRGVGMISRRGGEIATRPVCAGPPTQTPDGQCLGRHVLEYALVPGADEFDDAELLRASQDYRYGFLVTPQPVRFDPPVNIEGDVVFSCLKGAEDGDGLILRCYNPTASPVSIKVAGAFDISGARLDETAIGRALALGPGEIATFRLRPRAA